MNEIILNPRVKIDSFRKLEKLLKEATPEFLRVTKKQYVQYYKLLSGKEDGAFGYKLLYRGTKLLLPMKDFTGFDVLS